MPRGQFNPQNRTAPCDEPSEITDEQQLAARKIVADYCAQQREKGEWNDLEAKAALVDYMEMLGIYPGQEGADFKPKVPDAALGTLNNCSYTTRRR